MFSICFLSLFLFAHARDMPAIEHDLLAKYQRIDYWAADTSADPAARADSLEKANTDFQKALVLVSNQYPGSLHYDFKSLKKAGLFIATSSDGRFRIYSWDTETGGSMHFFLNVYQWSGNQHVQAKAVDADAANPGDPGVFCTPIYTMGAYYLVVNNAILSGKDVAESIQAFTIDKEKLNDSVHLFKTQTGLKNQIGFDYDFFSVVDHPERPLILTRYDSSTKTVYIPVVLPKGKVTNRWITYRWTGQYFEKAR